MSTLDDLSSETTTDQSTVEANSSTSGDSTRLSKGSSADGESKCQTTQNDPPRIFARWNRLADSMSNFHEYFKMEFDRLYQLSDGSFNEHRMTLNMYLREAEGLKKHLEAHHTIEERFIFPILAKRMPTFAQHERHLDSHAQIHHGLDRLSAFIQTCKQDPTQYKPEKMRECLDSFREVLYRHLDEEVADLGADNMKKYWKLEEVDRIVM